MRLRCEVCDWLGEGVGRGGAGIKEEIRMRGAMDGDGGIRV